MMNTLSSHALQPPRFNLLNFSLLDIEIDDTAHGLAFVARWNRQTKDDYPYSVADNSLLIVNLFTLCNPQSSTQWRRAVLFHDASEYVIGDMISPVKAVIGGQYKNIDKKLTIAIYLKFGLLFILLKVIKNKIKRADRRLFVRLEVE